MKSSVDNLIDTDVESIRRKNRKSLIFVSR